MKIFKMFNPRLAIYGKASGKLLFVTQNFCSLDAARKHYQNAKAVSGGKARLVNLNPSLKMIKLKPFEKAAAYIFTR